MQDAQPKTIYLKDYQVPPYLIDRTELHFSLGEEATVVRTRLSMHKNPASSEGAVPLRLVGQELVLTSLKLDGVELAAADYELSEDYLQLAVPEQAFIVETCVTIKPQENTSLEGLYQSNTMFCTQCEAEGFRKITYYLDRPDVMSLFTTTVVADREKYPVLLSNGNNVDNGSNDDGSHWSRWDDPFPKPSYLFALVAGDLAVVEDSFTTCSGRDVCLRIFVEDKDVDKCEHAMTSLINAMRWDEQTYGREYDLDIFNIVAVDDFNMGAMENKSLNIFNTSCVLAKPETTTDAGYQRVEGVVAHEYFHNWSGNRVTCRDWFQLSLKEGFTVYRDAQFSSDMGSETVKRVEDVSFLKTLQFSEDAGPLAHAIRPDSFIEISNFYTVTVYEKGAEVVRMIAHLLGEQAFRRGSDLYFDRHDGQAVTCEEFVVAMEDASGVDLKQFRNWYSQAGTPQLTAAGVYDEAARCYTLTVDQSCPATPGQQLKKPFHIPLSMALLGANGALPLQLQGDNDPAAATEKVLNITEQSQQFVFENVDEEPVPSLLRGFSAPVKLSFNYSREQLLFIMGNDSDGFCRWDAAQQLGVAVLNDMIEAHRQHQPMIVDSRLIDAYRQLLQEPGLDQAMVALLITLPTEAYMAELSRPVNVHAIHAARTEARVQIASQLSELLWHTYKSNKTDQAYLPSTVQVAQRSLKNRALDYLMLLPDSAALAPCMEQFHSGANMTDVLQSLVCLQNSEHAAEKKAAVQAFYQRWENEPLVINQWFSVQATSSAADTLEQVVALMDHPAFDITNPNKVRAVIGAFCGQNAVGFHRLDGAGYRFLADQIKVLDRLNPQIAARLLGPLTKWGKYSDETQALMKNELQRITQFPSLSRDVFEVASKSLAG